MGRGRAKAKQAKVARRLKYSGGGTDLDALRAEIIGEGAEDTGRDEDEGDEGDEYEDVYSKYDDFVEDDRADGTR